MGHLFDLISAVYKEGKLAAFIECQGEQHFMPIEEFGGERKFVIQQRNDEEKRKYAKAKDIKLIEISYKNKKYDKMNQYYGMSTLFR